MGGLLVSGSGSQNFVQSISNRIAVDTTTASVVFVDLLSTTLTIATGNIILVAFSFCASNDNAVDAGIRFKLVVDGVDRDGVRVLSALNTPRSGAILGRITGLAAGARIVKVQWRVGAGTGRINAASNPEEESAILLAAEVRT